MTNFGPVNVLAINTSRRTTTASDYARFLLDKNREGVFFMELTDRSRTDQGPLYTPPAAINTLPVNVTGDASQFQPVSETTLFSSRNWTGKPDDPLRPNRAARRRLLSAFRIRRTTPYFPSEDNRIVTTVANTTLDNEKRDLDKYVFERSLEASAAPLYHGPLDGSFGDMVKLAQPTIKGVETAGDELRLQFTNTATLFSNIPLQSAIYNGNGGLGGDPELRDTLMPFVVGSVFNMPPTLINSLLIIYQAHSGRVAGIGPVWEGANPIPFDRDYESYEALVAADIPAGHYATCRLHGLLRLSQPPTKKITCSVRGDATAGLYLQTSGSIILRALQLIGKRSTGDLSISTFSRLSIFPMGWYNERKDYSLAQFINLLLAPENAALGQTRTGRIGVIKHQPLETATPRRTLRIRPTQINAKVTQPSPISKQSVYYKWNWSPFTSDDEFSAAVPEVDRDQFRNQGLIASSTSARVSALRDDAVPSTKISWWTEAAAIEAQNQADIDVQLYGRSRLLYDVNVGREGFGIEDGEIVRIITPRFGFDEGRNVAAIVFDESAKGEQVTMEVVA